MIGANELTGDAGIEEAGQWQAWLRHTSLEGPCWAETLAAPWELVCVWACVSGSLYTQFCWAGYYCASQTVVVKHLDVGSHWSLRQGHGSLVKHRGNCLILECDWAWCTVGGQQSKPRETQWWLLTLHQWEIWVCANRCVCETVCHSVCVSLPCNVCQCCPGGWASSLCSRGEL